MSPRLGVMPFADVLVAMEWDIGFVPGGRKGIVHFLEIRLNRDPEMNGTGKVEI
jgi:hypothetical protein